MSRPPASGPSAAANPPERCRRHQCSAGRLHHPKRDEGGNAIGDGAGSRRGSEEPDADEEAHVAAVAFRQAPEKDQQGCVGDRVAVKDPRHVLKRRTVEVGGDAGQSDIDDEKVKVGQADADADDRQNLVRRRGSPAQNTRSDRRPLKRYASDRLFDVRHLDVSCPFGRRSDERTEGTR
jgi:hypothetical protein